LLQEDAVDTLSNQAAGLRIAHPGAHDQNPAFVADLARGRQELGRTFRAQVVIQEYEIELLLLEQNQAIADAGARFHGEAWIGGKRLGDALAEQSVVVDQQGADRPAGSFGQSCITLLPDSLLATTQL
jgi:hypothetical protein